jgi:hypothetical protein
MKNMYKKLISVLVILALLLAVSAAAFAAGTPIPGGAADEVPVLSPVANAILAEVPDKAVEEIRPMYNADETVLAYCAVLSGGGYIIQDVNGGLVQFSYEDPSPFEAAADGAELYIAGPMMFFERADEPDYSSGIGSDTGGEAVFVNVYNDEMTVTEEAFLENNSVAEKIEADGGVMSSAGLGAQYAAAADPTISANVSTSYVPQNYSYNPTGICAATATVSLLRYYDDHVNTNICVTSCEHVFAGNAASLTQALADRIYPGAVSKNAAAINWFINTYGNTGNYSGSSTSGMASAYTTLRNAVNSNRPAVIYFEGTCPSYPNPNETINHAVCAYGYLEFTDGTKLFRCVDGWGISSSVYVNRTFIYHLIRISN